MPASDERSRHGNVLDDVLREEIKDLTPEQVKRVLEYIETLKSSNEHRWRGQALFGSLSFCYSRRNLTKRTYSITFRISSSVRSCVESMSRLCKAERFDSGESTSPRR